MLFGRKIKMPISKRQIEKWSGAAGIVVAIVAGVYGVVAFVDNRIERRLTESDTLSKIASLVRPSFVFDERGSILYDSGAMQSIEDLKLEGPATEEGRKESSLPERITLRPKRLLRDAPILSVLDSFVVKIDVERGSKYDWVYKIQYTAMPTGDFKKCRYRVDILQ